MVGSGMFNFLNLRLQQIMGSLQPFGGVSLITVGDFFQLRPVFDSWIFETQNGNGYGPLATNLWQEYFKIFELTEIMRQKDDKQFAELLNRLRESKHTEDDIKILKTRILKEQPSSVNYPMTTTHLFVKNDSVDEHNNRIYASSTGDKAQVQAVDVIIGDVTDALKTKFKKQIPHDAKKTMGLFSVLDIAVGLKYDLTTNVSVTDGMTNGAECIVEKIDYRVTQSSRPSIIWVSFSQTAIGNNCRKEYSHLYNKDINNSWTPVLEISRQFRLNKRTNAQVLRKQFPLRPAAAKTIHRCQGDTLNEAVVDFPASTIQHIHYVGLSRVRNSTNLHILNLNENKIKVSESVQAEIHRLRTEAVLKPSLPNLYQNNQNTKKHVLTVLFHNVRSLHLHIQDVQNDYNVQAADVNIFVETALCSRDQNENFLISNFTLHRNDFDSSEIRPKYGTAVYIKNNIHVVQDPFRCNYNEVEITLMSLHYNDMPLYIIGIYRSSSKVSNTRLIDALKHVHRVHNLDCSCSKIFIGDFNVNIKSTSADQKALLNYFITEGYTQLINEYTTDYKSIIDHIYTNIPSPNVLSGVLESYYSDHKPIFMQVVN